MDEKEKFIVVTKAVLDNMGRLLEKKNRAYGNSINTATQIMLLLYPDGIKPEQIDDALVVVRILDKLSRIARGNKKAFGENPFRDILGYGALQCAKDFVALIDFDKKQYSREEIEEIVRQEFNKAYGLDDNNESKEK